MSELSEVRKIAEEISAQQSCYLYDLELTGSGSGRTLRVTIERDVAGGVGIEEISNVTRALNEVLDANEEMVPGGAYSLEVSSPGLERVLKTPKHFSQAIGKKIAVKTETALLGFNSHLPELGLAKQIHAWLVSFDDKGLKLSTQPPEGSDESEGDEESEPQFISVPFDQLLKSHVVFEMEDENKPKLKPREAWEASQARKKSQQPESELSASASRAAGSTGRSKSEQAGNKK